MSTEQATSVQLVRHAKAARRDSWVGPDELRPLTKAGRRQAEAIARLIEGPVARLVSSPYLRCVQTLEPLAEAQDLPVETADALGEGAPAEGALELALSLARSSGRAVLCTHGDVLASAVGELAAAGIPLEGPMEFKKGATWILDVGPAGFERGRYVPPPPKDAVD